jgi:hypothetical protein
MKSATSPLPPRIDEFACMQVISYDLWLWHQTMDQYLITAKGMVKMLQCGKTFEQTLSQFATARYARYTTLALRRRS